MMMGCSKCNRLGAIIFLILGLLFLFENIGVWNFFGIQWWTALFLAMGFLGLGHSSCADCQAIMYGRAMPAKKK